MYLFPHQTPDPDVRKLFDRSEELARLSDENNEQSRAIQAMIRRLYQQVDEMGAQLEALGTRRPPARS